MPCADAYVRNSATVLAALLGHITVRGRRTAGGSCWGVGRLPPFFLFLGLTAASSEESASASAGAAATKEDDEEGAPFF